MKHFWVALLILLPAGVCLGQYTVEVTSIPVWVKVLDKNGAPVRGLAKSEFAIFEDGKQIEPSCFEEIDLQSPASSMQEQMSTSAQQTQTSPTNSTQKYVLFLDLFNTTPREYAAIKPALQSFLDGLTGKNAQVMLAALMPDQRLGIIARYTSDIQRIRILLDFARANARRDVQAEERSKRIEEVLVVKQGSNENTNNFEDTVIDGYNTARSIAAQEAAISRHTLLALERFSDHLASTNSNDHATLIYVSGGFTTDPGRRFFRMVDQLDSRNSADAATNVGQSNRITGFFFQDELQKSIGKLNRLNVTMYTLDTRGMSADKEYQDSLVEMAQATGGLAFYNSENFTEALRRISNDIEHQYLICYPPPQHKSEGTYHAIRVDVKKNDVNVRSRDGYWD